MTDVSASEVLPSLRRDAEVGCRKYGEGVGEEMK